MLQKTTVRIVISTKASHFIYKIFSHVHAYKTAYLRRNKVPSALISMLCGLMGWALLITGKEPSIFVNRGKILESFWAW